MLLVGLPVFVQSTDYIIVRGDLSYAPRPYS